MLRAPVDSHLLASQVLLCEVVVCMTRDTGQGQQRPRGMLAGAVAALARGLGLKGGLVGAWRLG
jgi:hypothetical protein